MGVNRKIKSDGEIHIEGTNVDIDSTVDIAGNVNATGNFDGANINLSGDATVGGDANVTGNVACVDVDATGDVGGATATITGNASVGGNASVTGNVSCVDVDATGDLGGATATITGNASVGGNASVTGNVSCVDVDATGDLGGATLTTTSNASVGGNVSCVDVDATGDVGSATVTTTGNATIGGNASVTGNVSCVDIDATGDLGGATVTTTGNATIGGNVDATGDLGGATATITGNASVGGDLTVTGDTSTTDLTASGTGSFTGNLSVSSINNLTFPTSDGSSGQAITTNGSGVLTFSTISGGGGGGSADVDTIASASDATNYTGTARFINITSTAAVTFTNATIENRIIYNTGGQNVTFEVDNFKSNIYRSSGSGYLYITSKGDGTDSGVDYNNMNITDCDILNGNWVVISAGSENASGSGQTDLSVFMSRCRINASTQFNYTSAGYGKHYVGMCNITGWNVYNNETRDDSLLVRQGSRIDAQNFYGYANIYTNATINAGSSNGNTIKIENLYNDILINGTYNYPFRANNFGIIADQIVSAEIQTNDQSMSGGLEKIEFNNALINTAGIYDPNTNFRTTIKIKGYYRIDFTILTFNVTTTTPFLVYIYKNGSSIGKSFQGAITTDNSVSKSVYASYMLDLEVDDYIELYAYSTDTSYTIQQDHSSFSISKIN